MIIGTAGHIDHGKTSLVKALTGIDTDRLKEEKRRGITLELGFAHLTLPDGTVAGVVDVPGHERFIKAMVAGAGGMDLALLVVAADEGVMPQTREHLDICRLLGIRSGVVALTKSDLLPDLGEDWLPLVKSDLAALVAGTFLESAPVIPCSSRTGEGLPALLQALATQAKALSSRPLDGPLYLPVDRAFTVKGFGTVVTGTLLSGLLSIEDPVSLLPGLPGPLRVRGLQVHGVAVEKVSAGQRTAVNLSGVETESIFRGMALTRPGELPATRMLDAELTLLPTVESPLPRRSKWLLHLGTAQVEATVALLEDDELHPGETALAQLRLGEPVAALPQQHFILRGSKTVPGRGTTVAGGRVLGLDPPRRRRGSAALLAPLREGGPEVLLPFLLRQAGYRGLSVAELFARSAIPPKALSRALELLGARSAVLLIDREKRHYVAAEVFTGLLSRAQAQLAAFHQREPMREGLGKEELRQKLGVASERLFTRLLGALIESGKVEAEGEWLRLKGRGRALTASDETARSKAVEAVRSAGLAPPTVAELAHALGLPLPRTLELLKVAATDGALTKVTDDLYFDRSALESLKERLIAQLKEHRELTTQAFKELVGQSRKFVIPLSEYFDREKVTLRVGEKRVLRRG